MKTVEEEVKELSESLKINSITRSLLIRIFKSRDEEVRKEQQDKSVRAVKFSADRFPNDQNVNGLEYAITVDNAIKAIKEG